MYCLPSFFSVNGFYGFYSGILHGRAPIVSTPGQIPAMSSHPLKFSPSSPPCSAFFGGFFLFVMLLCGGSLLWASRGNRSTLLLEPVALAQFLGKVKGLLVKAAWKPHLVAALAHEAGPAVIGEEFAGGMLSSYSETTCRNFRPLTPWGISSQ